MDLLAARKKLERLEAENHPWKNEKKKLFEPNLHNLGRSKCYWVVVSNIFYFHPYLGKIPILTNIFQMGWNHQPDHLKQIQA